MVQKDAVIREGESNSIIFENNSIFTIFTIMLLDTYSRNHAQKTCSDLSPPPYV